MGGANLLIYRGSNESSVICFWAVWVSWLILLLVLFSSPVKSADIRIEVVDPSTGKATSTYEKTYSPQEKEQIKGEVEQKRRAEETNRQMEDLQKKDAEENAKGGISRKQVELERRRLQEELDNLRNKPIPQGTAQWVTLYQEARAKKEADIQSNIDLLDKDPEYYFYKESQDRGKQDKESRSDFLPKVGK
jgi:hypothetical protein